MIYTVKQPTYTKKTFKQQFKRDALKKLIYFPKNHNTELLLNNYLKQTYSLDLWTACKLIIFNCTIDLEKDNTYVITISNHYWDTIARIITFGTGKIKGSQILRFLFDTRLI